MKTARYGEPERFGEIRKQIESQSDWSQVHFAALRICELEQQLNMIQALVRDVESDMNEILKKPYEDGDDVHLCCSILTWQKRLYEALADASRPEHHKDSE